MCCPRAKTPLDPELAPLVQSEARRAHSASSEWSATMLGSRRRPAHGHQNSLCYSWTLPAPMSILPHRQWQGFLLHLVRQPPLLLLGIRLLVVLPQLPDLRNLLPRLILRAEGLVLEVDKLRRRHFGRRRTRRASSSPPARPRTPHSHPCHRVVRDLSRSSRLPLQQPLFSISSQVLAPTVPPGTRAPPSSSLANSIMVEVTLNSSKRSPALVLIMALSRLVKRA